MMRLLAVGMVALLPSCSSMREPPEQVPEPSQATAPEPVASDHPLGTGSVEFVGFDQATLQDIRVIPEVGTAMFVPQGNTRIENVDGFWWRGSRQWFKIPDHCHTKITWTESGLTSTPECSELGKRIQRLRGALVEPAWQIDSGATGHGTDYPF